MSPLSSIYPNPRRFLYGTKKSEVDFQEVWKEYDFFTTLKQELKDNNAKIEIVFVSSDRSENDMKSYMNESHGDWMAIPWGSPITSYVITFFSSATIIN